MKGNIQTYHSTGIPQLGSVGGVPLGSGVCVRPNCMGSSTGHTGGDTVLPNWAAAPFGNCRTGWEGKRWSGEQAVLSSCLSQRRLSNRMARETREVKLVGSSRAASSCLSCSLSPLKNTSCEVASFHPEAAASYQKSTE